MKQYQYMICFSTDPVQFGFVCRNLPDYKQFKGFNAFNQYFDMLAPDTNAKVIPDVWDGYYRIMLVQFDTTTSPEELRNQLKSFRPTISDIHIERPLFQTSKISVAPECFRLGRDFSSEPIALYVTRPPEFAFDSVLKEIRKQIDRPQWNQIPERWLHMNIRLYSASTRGNWTWREIRQQGIHERVREHIIEFHHTTLQIIPSRETCKRAYENEGDSPWWTGVTELEGRCSGCKHSVKEDKWKGICQSCNEYERIKPIWSIPYSATV